MTPSVAIAIFGLSLSALIAAIGAIRWLINMGAGIQRIEDKIERIEGLTRSVDALRTSVTGLQIRVAKIEGGCTANHAAPTR